MKKPIPLTGSSPDLGHDPIRARFLASLQAAMKKTLVPGTVKIKPLF